MVHHAEHDVSAAVCVIVLDVTVGVIEVQDAMLFHAAR
jgi:hypothetical protein